MTDLRGFLLARIAEELASARTSFDLLQARGPGVDPLHSQGGTFLGWDAARVIAECDIKRWIVAECTASTGVDAGWAERHILPLLALPYADHPKFEDEWLS